MADLGAIIVAPSRFAVQRGRDIAQVAPELRNAALYVPFSVTNMTMLRALRQVASRPTRPVSAVAVERRCLDAPTGHGVGGGSVEVVIYEPHTRAQPSGALVWIHSGGRIAGSVASDHRLCSFLADQAGAVVVSVDYRLAPEHPFPAGLDDIRRALLWVHATAGEWGIDPQRVAIGGASAGGGLAAETSQWAHDVGVPVAFQLLVYPMLDDRTIAADPNGRGRLIWTAASNRFAWSAYLGHLAGAGESRPYAVAARRDDLDGLPPAWIAVGDLDLFYDEAVAYAARLEQSGVSCVLDVVPGMYHGADVVSARQPPSMAALWSRMAEALATAIE